LVYGIFGRSLDEILSHHGYRSHPRISSRLRGWRYRERPLKPAASGFLPVSTIASGFCPTARDVYLRYIEGLEMPLSPPMVRGGLYHNTLEAVITHAKQLIYRGLTPDFNLLRELIEGARPAIEGLLKRRGEQIDLAGIKAEEFERIKRNMVKLWHFEASQLAAAVAWELSRVPRIGVDSLVAHAIPLTMEHRIDGSRIGLSRQLSVDAFQALRTMIMEMKTGREQEYHKLTLAGYALAFESTFGRAVNFGMLAYVRFPEGRPVPYVFRRVHPIDGKLRTQFLRERDRKLQILSSGRDPGMPRRCPSSCGYFEVCRGK
jgi:CRISPR-associated protein Csa1